MDDVLAKSRQAQAVIVDRPPAAIVEAPEDAFAWDSRLRKLAACCRHSNTAPVSFYGLRKVCDIEPLTWEDRDIVRLEVKQLCDSFEGVCNALRGTDDLLVSGKKLEQEQIRALASSFSHVRDELDLKDAALVAAARKTRALETDMLREKFGRMAAEEEKTEAQGSYMANHRIFSAMESVVLHTKMDADAMHGKTINNLKEELIGASKYIVQLKSDNTKQQAQLVLSLQDAEARVKALEAEVAAGAAALESEQVAHGRHKDDFLARETELESEVADVQAQLAQRGAALEATEQMLEQEQTRAAEDQARATANLERMIEQRDQLQRDSAVVVADYKEQVANLQKAVKAEQDTVDRTKKIAEDTSQLLSLKETELKELNQKMEDEVRRLNGNYLRMRGEVKDAVKALEDEKLGRADDNEAAGLREKELLALIEGAQREVAKAVEEKRIAEQRLQKEQLKRATAIVESQAERSLREATEHSKVFDSVRYDVAYDQQERSDLDRVLDAATYQLTEVSNTNQAILQSTNRFASQFDAQLDTTYGSYQ